MALKESGQFRDRVTLTVGNSTVMRQLHPDAMPGQDWPQSVADIIYVNEPAPEPGNPHEEITLGEVQDLGDHLEFPWVVIDRRDALDVDELAAYTADYRDIRLGELAAQRFTVEIGGLTVASVWVTSDRQSQQMITGALTMIREGTATSVAWKTPSGFLNLDAVQVGDFHAAISTHVEDSFSRESVLYAEMVAAADCDAMDAIDITQGWPSNA